MAAIRSGHSGWYGPISWRLNTGWETNAVVTAGGGQVGFEYWSVNFAGGQQPKRCLGGIARAPVLPGNRQTEFTPGSPVVTRSAAPVRVPRRPTGPPPTRNERPAMTVRPASQASTPAAGRLATVLQSARPHRRRQGRAAETGAGVHAGARPPADRGHPGRGQVHAGAGAGRDAGPQVFADPVHERPAAGRRAGRVDLRRARAVLPLPCRARSSARSCSPTKSTARRPRRRARCSRRWKSGRCRRTARRASCPTRSSSSPRRTRSSRSARIRCRSRSSTAS